MKHVKLFEQFLNEARNKEALAKDTEESDMEYIKTRQERNKIAQRMYKKDYRDLDLQQRDLVNSKL